MWESSGNDRGPQKVLAGPAVGGGCCQQKDKYGAGVGMVGCAKPVGVGELDENSPMSQYVFEQ